MPALESHTGLLRQTIPHYNRRSFIDVSGTNQYYTAFPALKRNMKRVMAGSKTGLPFQFGLPVEVKSEGGTEFKFNIQVTSNNTLAWVGEDDPVGITKKDFQVQAALPWRLARLSDWSYGEWELSACKGKEELVSLITSRTLGNQQGAADGLENWFWGVPPASTDDKTAFPMRYYLYIEPESTAAAYTNFTGISTTTKNGNFLNVNHNSFTAGPMGQSRATYRMLGNWNCQYTTFSDTDAVEKITHAMLDTGWQSPVDSPSMVKDAPDRAMYTTKANLIVRGRMARQQNDANGSDLLSRFTETDVYRTPMMWVPQLEDPVNYVLYGTGQKDPIYGIDWNTWYWASKSGFHMEDKVFPPSREAPHTYTHALFLGGQLVCLVPRRNFVLSK